MLTVIAMLSWWSICHASEVVLQSPTSPDVEYRAYLAAHADSLSPTEALTRMRPGHAAREKLVNDFADSQKAFLGADADLARVKLESLLTQIPDEDWSPSERQVFFKSALRRAQLARDDQEIDSWLKVAITIGFQFTPDPTLFPPPLILRWRQLKQQIPLRNIQVPGLGEEWTRLLINGVTCSAASCPAFAETGVPVRMTWLSDKWQPYTVVTPLSRLPHETPARKPWVTGHCQSPQFDQSSKIFQDRQAFFGLACEKSRIAGANLNLRPTPPRPDLNMFPPSKKDRPIYKSPWLWAGVGTVLAILVVESQKNSEKKEPSTSYGY